jgi:cell division protein ZapD
MIVYEYPLSERIRVFLRLEDLFERLDLFTARDHALDHQVALAALFELLEVALRADLKTELLQELERQRQALTTFKNDPEVSSNALGRVMQEIDHSHQALANSSGKPGQHLRDNEWLMNVRSRMMIPGGACEFDLPMFHAWLHRPAAHRLADLTAWIGPLKPVRDAMRVALRLLRESGQRSKQNAAGGSFQQELRGRQYQLLQVELDDAVQAVPEISANKYMLWIRFNAPSTELRPRAQESDVPFELVLCNF